MSLIKFGNKVIGFNGKLINWEIPNTPWVFTWTGYNFFGPYPNRLSFQFKFPATIKVDFGNGVIKYFSTYDQGAVAGDSRYVIQFQYAYPSGAVEGDGTVYAGRGGYGYIYPDGLNIKRTISITFNNRSALTGFYEGGIGDQPFTLKFAQFTSLTGITLQDRLSEANVNIEDITALPKLGYLVMSTTFIIFPIQIFLTKLTTYVLNLSSSNYGVSFSQNNLDKLNSLKATLTQLTVTGLLKDTDGVNDCPISWSELQLKSLILNNGSAIDSLSNTRAFYKLPSVFETQNSLTDLTLSFCSDLTNTDRLSSLINFTLSPYTGAICNRYLNSSLPGFFKIGTLKNVNFNNPFRCAPNPQQAIDTFITNIYNYIVSVATMFGPNTLPYRGLKVYFGMMGVGTSGTRSVLVADLDVTSRNPSGTYQQPLRYIRATSTVQGDNGLPQSPMEMIWVLSNQYSWTFTFPTPYTYPNGTINLLLDILLINNKIRIVLTTPVIPNNNRSINGFITYIINGVNTIRYFSTTIRMNTNSTTYDFTFDATEIKTANVTIYSIDQQPATSANQQPTEPVLLAQNPYTKNF